MACQRQYLSLCAIPKVLSREGHSGANAKIYVPFAGLVWFSGDTPVFPHGTIAQDTKTFTGGVTKPNTFSKSCCS